MKWKIKDSQLSRLLRRKDAIVLPAERFFTAHWDGISPCCPHCFQTFGTWSRAKIHVKFCRKGSSPRRSIVDRYKHMKGNEDMSIKDTFKAKGVEGPPLLHGTDLPAKVSSVTVIVKEIRSAPDNFNSIAIMDFKTPVYECESWAINKTNMKALLEKFNLTDEVEIEELSEKMKGKKITLTKVMVNNPQTKKPTPSLFVA